MPIRNSYTMLARSACGFPVASGTYYCSLPARPSSAARGATASSLQYVATPLYAMRCDVLRLKHESLHSALGCSDTSGTAGQVTQSWDAPNALLGLCPALLLFIVSQHVHHPGQVASSCRMALSDFEILVSWMHTRSAAMRVTKKLGFCNKKPKSQNNCGASMPA